LVSAFNKNDLITEILLKNGFNLSYKTEKQEQFIKNDIYLASDGEKEALVCLDYVIDPETITYFKTHTDTKFICLERALDTTKKYNLKLSMGNMFHAF
jgi:adenine-specific DNA-methyltransferase